MSFGIGLIGAGAIGRLHADTAAKVGTRIVGFCDVDEGKAEAAAAAHDGAIATSSVTELLGHPDVSAVVVAVPNHLHHELAIQVIESGTDLLLEKPMATSVARCDAVLEAMRGKERIVQLGFVSRYAPAARLVRDLIDAGRLGRIYHARATWIRRRGIPGLGGWFTAKEKAGGGVLIDLGVHMIDLVLHLTDRPRALRVSGTCTSTFGSPIESYTYTEMWAGPPRPDGVFDVEDAATALIRFEGGLTMELTTTWAANVPEGAVPTGVMLMGEKGGCFFDVWSDRVELATEQDGYLVDIRPHLPAVDAWSAGFEREHELFNEAVLTRTPPDASAQHGRDVQAIIDAIYRSSAEGREVEI